MLPPVPTSSSRRRSLAEGVLRFVTLPAALCAAYFYALAGGFDREPRVTRHMEVRVAGHGVTVADHDVRVAGHTHLHRPAVAYVHADLHPEIHAPRLAAVEAKRMAAFGAASGRLEAQLLRATPASPKRVRVLHVPRTGEGQVRVIQIK